MASCGEKFILPDIPPAPHHPSCFSKQAHLKNLLFGDLVRIMVSRPFLHYDEVGDVAYCHICITAFK